MNTDENNFTAAELQALKWLKENFSILVTRIEDKNRKDLFGDIVPGMSCFKKLAKKGFCFQTIEEPTEDGFLFTESIELTEIGEQLVKTLHI